MMPWPGVQFAVLVGWAGHTLSLSPLSVTENSSQLLASVSSHMRKRADRAFLRVCSRSSWRKHVSCRMIAEIRTEGGNWRATEPRGTVLPEMNAKSSKTPRYSEEPCNFSTLQQVCAKTSHVTSSQRAFSKSPRRFTIGLRGLIHQQTSRTKQTAISQNIPSQIFLGKKKIKNFSPQQSI